MSHKKKKKKVIVCDTFDMEYPIMVCRFMCTCLKYEIYLFAATHVYTRKNTYL